MPILSALPHRVRTARLVAAAGLLALGCARQGTPTPDPARASSDSSSYSVYDLGSSWRDQRGAERTLASLAGRPRLVAMVYTHCAATCPLTVAEMKRIAAGAGPGLGMVLVSLDPARDSTGRLAEWAAEQGLDPAQWTLLRGTDADVRDLAAALGVRYRRLSPDDIAHANLLTLLDASGAIVHRQAGLGEAAATVRAAHALLAIVPRHVTPDTR